MNPNELSALADFLRGHDDYMLVCHENPDGDSLGSLFALKLGLMQLNKCVQTVCVDGLPHKYRMIAGAETLLPIEQLQPFSHLICIDCADLARTGLPDAVLAKVISIVNIDHHASNNGFGQWNLFSAEAAATGVLVYRLLLALGVVVTTEIANDLFVAISSDTGHFMHANTDAECLRVASDLVSYGAQPNRIAREMFQTATLGWVKLLGQAIRSLEIRCGGKAAMMFITLQDFKDTGTTAADVEGLIDIARNIETVEVAILLRETDDGQVKVSMRSKEGVDVGKIAAAFLGGGHKRAAGFSMETTLAEAKNTIIKVLEGLQF
jgi:bifunctional oligoribonuclease and PAP phosphatase NrnA